MNFEFNPDDHIDSNFFLKFLDSPKYYNLTNKLKEDLHISNKDNTYANIIKMYNSSNISEIPLNNKGVLSTVESILASIKYNKVNFYSFRPIMKVDVSEI
jgi:hypothetical protein